MSKETVQLDLTGVTQELPYRNYYKGRNGLVAKYIAEYLGIPYSGEMGIVENNVYYVPPVTQERGSLVASVVKNSEDFYGLIVDDYNHVGKSILHMSVTQRVPNFYSFDFAKSVENLVIPGISIFSRDDLRKGYLALRRFGKFDARLKLSDKSDGHGQFLIKTPEDLMRCSKEIDDEYIKNKGFILEANLEEAKTISIGFAILGRNMFSFMAIQKNDIAPEDGRNRYVGANVRVVKGEIDNLLNISENDIEKEAVEVGRSFYERYKSFNPIASRLSFDFLYGKGSDGNDLAGVTDITGRLGGTCPALVLAANEFKDNSGLSMVRSEVTLNYETNKEMDSEKGAVRFVDLPSLRLSARVNFKK